ncbi:Signal transduction histidine kinase [Micromonospora citrea]|uniref:histidine kinase n=1 Tax=Micromonospora citrea TaxID=47855 RepID=A0A1C6TTJ4_9ACTN|nr:histidine kinase [Micromonospora citrea]SCL44973.1 Signal transduction histidine kinase [Micromonospora citrea]
MTAWRTVWWRRWARSPWSDAALAVCAAVAQLWPLLSRDGPWHWWGYVVTVGSALPLVARRKAPVTVLLVSCVFGASYDLVDDVAPQPLWYGSLIAIYTVAARSGRWTRWGALAMLLVGGLLTVGSSDTALRGVVVSVTAYALGRAAAGSRAHAAVLEERAARLERERVLEAERAAERERARIAREMHDILAHAVSLMVVQAEAGPVAVRADPERAVATFDAIAAAGRDAMDQLRRMLVVLRQDRGTAVAQAAIEDLPALVRQAAGAGLEVGYHVAGEPRPLPPAFGVAVYRIVQEALTNVVKHAGASRADVRLSWQEQELGIEIRDNGRGAGTGLPSGGNGLTGIRERAAACGGTASAGPGPAGFTVRARLPL